MAEHMSLEARAEREVGEGGGFVSFVSASPEPLPNPLPPVPSLNSALLPDSVRRWCEDAAESIQVPLDFTAIPAMVALASSLGGRRIAVRMKRNAAWFEHPILWGCVIGRPSSGKSPALSPARRMLEKLEATEREAWEVKRDEFVAMVEVSKMEASNAQEAARKALKKGANRSDVLDQLQGAKKSEDKIPEEPRIVVNDATVEKLGELLNANPLGLVQFRDELMGWLATMDREGRESDRAFWLECWNGAGGYTVDRIGRGTIRIEACAVSVLGGAQPGKLADYVRGAVRGGFADDGLMQRFQLAVYPDLPSSWRYTDRALDPAAEAEARAAFARMRNLQVDAIGAIRDGSSDVPYLHLSDDAQSMFIEWLEELMPRLREGAEPPHMESHLAKYQSLAGRLALILHLADGGSGPVSGNAMARALGWCEYLEGHARRIYAPASDNGLSAAHLLLKKRPSLPDGFTARDVYRKGWAGLTDAEVVAGGLDTLAEYRHVHETSVPSRDAGGRPTVEYRWAA